VNISLLIAAVPAAGMATLEPSALWRLLTLEDSVLRLVALGILGLSVSCGLLGGFMVVRRQALFGDVLAHAVLPGIAIGFLVVGSKDPFALFLGALAAGLLGAWLVGTLRATAPIREDTALGVVLGGFFGVGMLLMTRIQSRPQGGHSGLDHVFFGQIAGLSEGDVMLLLGVAAVVLLVVIFGYRQLLAASFDPDFAKVSGMRPRRTQALLLGLLAATVVTALPAVGVVLVTALLITPAATAALLTHRLPYLLALSVLFTAIAGSAGAAVSYLGTDLPTGPFMVLAASLLFGITLLFAPERGLVPRGWRQRQRRRRIARENTLKSVYQIEEAAGAPGSGVRLGELAARRREAVATAERDAEALVAAGLATLQNPSGSTRPSFTEERHLCLTASGSRRAREIVRNHRLWETYLAEAAQFPSDHVHDDAEAIEHLLTEETVRRLEARLGHPARDPHGSVIPVANGGHPADSTSTKEAL